MWIILMLAMLGQEGDVAGEDVAQAICDNQAVQKAARQEILCRRAIGTARVTGKTQAQVRALRDKTCRLDRWIFEDLESFDELEGLVEELSVLMAEQKEQYKTETGKNFKAGLCR